MLSALAFKGFTRLCASTQREPRIQGAGKYEAAMAKTANIPVRYLIIGLQCDDDKKDGQNKGDN